MSNGYSGSPAAGTSSVTSAGSPLLESPENLFFLSVLGYRLFEYGFGGTRDTLISTRDGGARPSSDSGVDYVYVMDTVFCHQVLVYVISSSFLSSLCRRPVRVR